VLSLGLATVFPALILATNAFTDHLAFTGLINGEAIGERLPTPAPITIRPPRARALPMLIRWERRAPPVIWIAQTRGAQQQA
jgi:hypothetical protein